MFYLLAPMIVSAVIVMFMVMTMRTDMRDARAKGHTVLTLKETFTNNKESQ